MNVCEACNGQEEILKRQMADVLCQYNVDPEKFVTSDHKTRLELIKESFSIARKTENHKIDGTLKDSDGNIGLVVIKPEMYHASRKIEFFLSRTLGLNVLAVSDFVYTPEEYWHTHGDFFIDYFDKFPYSSLLFLLSITASSQAVMFEHKTATEYRGLFTELTNGHGVAIDCNSGMDTQAIFTELFIRNKIYSIRENICREEAANNGLLSMNTPCPAKCWDFTHTFCKRSVDENARTFNGIHSPRDRDELLLDLSILSRVYSTILV